MKLVRALVVTLLFAALVVALLTFQGILFRHVPATHAISGPPRLAAGAATGRVVQRELLETRSHAGFVEAVDPAPVAARVMATVRELVPREGEAVAAGQVLARLDDADARARQAQARSALTAAEAAALQADLAFARAERLLEAEALTPAEWEGARAARDGSAAVVERARAAVEEAETALSWFELRAPFDGVVLARHADPGQLAAPGQPLLTLYRAEHLRLAVPVPAADAGALEPGVALGVEVEGVELAATLERVLPGADPRTGTLTLHLTPPPEADLRPGLLVRLALPGAARQALFVPAAAVQRIGQVERVQVVDQGRVRPRHVRTGKRHVEADGAELLEVLAGLSAGEEVVLP